ncbi:adenylate/guanylate cyclase domain-containing protein [Methylobacterium sp. WSM2598]|uniref:adenylate/guanylate cyclase domain-containing protein n=1 Tax=Methylobacterium sp. WSM2598 TaxID=398261 RepID=UPI000370D48A|nr:CHASE3 domain-containing protein [Methylobacterium sp. WSM2598]
MRRLRLLRSPGAVRMSAGFAALIGMMLIALGAFVYQHQGTEAVRHTVMVDAQLGHLLSAVQEAETQQRGFLLTGDARFLDAFAASEAMIADEFEELEALVRDAPEQRARAERLRGLIAAKRADLAATVDLSLRDGRDAVARALAGGPSKPLMDEIRGLLRQMEQQEAALMEARRAQVSRVALTIWVLVALVATLLAVLAVSAVREAGRRASLSRFLPEELVTRLADDVEGLRAGRRQFAAIVFVDLRGSTGLAERLDPHALSVLLTAFRRRIIRLARLHGGVVDKFIGDGALLVFGLPEPRPDDAARALAFARSLAALAGRPSARWARPHGIGIGVHYGEVFCGIIGQQARLEFTVLGDTVNVAARLEQATKVHGVAILASEAACRAAGARGGAWREVSRAPLRGRREAMAYYAPAAEGTAPPVAAIA